MKNKKIIFLVPDVGINYDQNGGAGTHIRGTIDGFRSYGIDVLPIIAGDIFNPEKDSKIGVQPARKQAKKSYLKRLVPAKARLLFRDVRRIYTDYKFQSKIKERIKQYAPDAIYERSSLFSTCGIKLSHKYKIPLILESDGCMPEIFQMDYGLFSVRLANLMEKYKLKKATYISAYNEYSKKILAKKFDVPINKIIVKPLGISNINRHFEDSEVTQLKQTYGLQDKKVVGFVGAISKYHGVNLLIECAEMLTKMNNKNISIIIVGWSKEAEELKHRTQKSNLTNVVFTGKIDKNLIPLYYRMFDLGVIPGSEPTIYPVKVLEYGAYGLCPVIPDYNVFNEIISDKIHGYYFKQKSVSSLTKVLIEILESDSYKTVAENWQQKVLTVHTWKNSVKEIVDTVFTEK